MTDSIGPRWVCGWLIACVWLVAGHWSDDGWRVGLRDAEAAGRVLKTWQITEQLQKRWARELMSLPFPGARRATCPRGQMPLLFGPGKRAVPHQVFQGQIYFFVFYLRPLQRQTYSLRCVSQRRPPPSDFNVALGRGSVRFGTSRLIASFPLGAARNPKGLPLANVPGPLRKMTVRHRNKTIRSFGGSQMYGPDRIVAYSSKLVAKGPVFARVAMMYHYKGSKRGRYEYKLHVTAEVRQNGGQIWWSSRIETIGARTSQRQRKRSGWRMVLARRELPTLVLKLRPFHLVRAALRSSSSAFARALTKDQPRSYTIANAVYGDLHFGVWRWPSGMLVGYMSPWRYFWDRRSFTRLVLLHGPARRRRPLFEFTTLNVGRWVKPKSLARARRHPGANYALSTSPTIRRRGKGRQASLVFELSNTRQHRFWRWGGPRGTVGVELDRVQSYVLNWPEVTPSTPLGVSARMLVRHRRQTRATSPAFRRKAREAGRLVDRWIKAYNRRVARARTSIGLRDKGYIGAIGALRAVIAVNLADRSKQTLAASGLKRLLKTMLFHARDDQQHVAPPEDFDWSDAFFFRYHSFIVIHLYSLLRSLNLWESPVERRRYRALMAYFAYKFFRPEVLSAERGYATGSLNLTTDVAFARGMLSALFPKHPRSRTWLQYGLRWERFFLRGLLGPKGESPLNDAYSLGLIKSYLLFAMTSRGKGSGIRHVQFRRLVDYMMMHYTPPDPRFSRWQRVCSYNRSQAGRKMGLPGILALSYYLLGERDLSARLQYFWKAEGGSVKKGIGIIAFQLWFSRLLVDPSLPASTPQRARYPSSHNANFTLFRHGDKGPFEGEHYMFFNNTANAQVGLPNSGSVQDLFAYGQPIASSFGNGVANVTVPRLSFLREGPLLSRVLISRAWMTRKPFARGRYGARMISHDYAQPVPKERRFASTSRLDYVAYGTRLGFSSSRSLLPLFQVRQGVLPGPAKGKYKARHRPYAPIWPRVAGRSFAYATASTALRWRRQIAFLKEADAAGGVHYYVFRDTMTSQLRQQVPSEWVMWTLTNGLYPSNTRAKRKLGRTIKRRAQRLSGDRFTALGRVFKNRARRRQSPDKAVDVEYFVAQPVGTPRHTLRWGMMFRTNDHESYGDYQDLLHLQRRGNGSFFVVLFPRRRAARRPPAPTFRALGPKGKSKVIWISGKRLGGGTFTDLVYMADKGERHSLANVPLPQQRGAFLTASKVATVQYRNGRLASLSLGAIDQKGVAGFVQVPGHRLASKAPCTLLILPRKRQVQLQLSRGVRGPVWVSFQLPYRLRGLSGRRQGRSYLYRLRLNGLRSFSF